MKVIIVFLRFLTQFAFRWKFQYLCNSRAANLIETGRFLLVFKAFKRQKSPFLNSEKYYLEFEFPISALKFRYGLFRSPYFKPLFYHLQQNVKNVKRTPEAYRLCLLFFFSRQEKFRSNRNQRRYLCFICRTLPVK